MARSLKKGPFVDEFLVKRVEKQKLAGDHTPIKTWSRRSTIMPEFVGVHFSVYNGKKFINVFISENMVGHKLGEFSHSRTFKKHSSDKGMAKGIK